MKIFLFLAALCCTLTVVAQDAPKALPKFPAEKAKTLIGTNCVIYGTIADVHKTEKLARLNFDKPYPKQTFTAVVFARSFDNFPDLEKLKGKSVEVSGKVEEYNGHPQIILNNKKQLKILEGDSDKKGDDKAEKEKDGTK